MTGWGLMRDQCFQNLPRMLSGATRLGPRLPPACTANSASSVSPPRVRIGKKVGVFAGADTARNRTGLGAVSPLTVNYRQERITQA